MSTDLHSSLIRLAHMNEALRPHLLPLLKHASGEGFQPGDPAMWGSKKVLVVDTHGYGERQTADVRWTISGVSGSRDEVSGHKRNVPVAELTKLPRRASTRQASLPVGHTFESERGLFRIHRYRPSLEITDLTNAGKRGKKVRQTSVWDTDMIRDPQASEDWENMVDKLPLAPSYDAVIKIINSHLVSMEMFNPNARAPQIQERELRGVDVAPASFAPMKIETPEFELEAGYDSFSVMDKRDTNNLPACIPSSRGGKGAVKQFFRWVTDNEARIKRMTYNELTSAMYDAGLEFHAFCRMD